MIVCHNDGKFYWDSFLNLTRVPVRVLVNKINFVLEWIMAIELKCP